MVRSSDAWINDRDEGESSRSLGHDHNAAMRTNGARTMRAHEGMRCG
jgi:hypothetical protein